MMTHEQRLDRLERIAKLFAGAGFRLRRDVRRMDEKITILIDAQIRNEDLSFELKRDLKVLMIAQAKNDERFAKSDERFAAFEKRSAKYDKLFAQNEARFRKFDERFAKSDKRFAAFERRTEQTMKTIKQLMKERKNGNA
jgi:hypothetical protein